MPQVLSELKLDEVSLVDRPACSTVDDKGKKTPRAVIALYKRDVDKGITVAEKDISRRKATKGKEAHDYGPEDEKLWANSKTKTSKSEEGEVHMTMEELEARVTKQETDLAQLTKRNADLDAENAMVLKMSKGERKSYAEMDEDTRKAFMKADVAKQGEMMVEAKRKRREKKLKCSMDDALKAEYEAAGPVQKAAILEEFERMLKAAEAPTTKSVTTTKTKSAKTKSWDDEEEGDEEDDEEEEVEDREKRKAAKVDKADDNTNELRLQLAAAEDRIAKSESQLETLRKRERDAHFAKRAEDELPNTPGTPEEKGTILQKLADTFGEESQSFKKLLGDLRNADQVLGNQFSEIGKAARGDIPALSVFDGKVEEIAKRDKIDKAHAVEKAMMEAPELYLDYERSQRQIVARA